MEINGKIYRILEGQVEYLTGKWGDLQDQINDVRAHLTHYVIVDALPTEDIDTSAVYLVGPLGTAPDQYYEEWVYVQKTDESWMWEKLGDTASVDLSGYLQKDTSTTPYAKAYIKKADGSQDTVSMTSSDPTQGFVAQWGSGGRMATKDPVNSSDAVNKSYGDFTYLAKQTSVTTYNQLYRKNADGTQTLVDVYSAGNDPNTVVQRDSYGRINCANPGTGAGDGINAVNKQYADATYLAKDTTGSTYGKAYIKNTDGSQGMANLSSGIVNSALVVRTAAGQINVPAAPTDATHAASKAYVDATVGQLLYLHDLEIIITVDSTNKLYVKAYLVNGSATAITMFDRILYKRIDVQWGAFGPNMSNVEAVAVSKLPDTFRQDEFDDPFIGFLYQYISGGNLVSGKTTSSMSSTITDTVISF